jgi:predicted  nucleic acid-binding Zn-ribbon protein
MPAERATTAGFLRSVMMCTAASLALLAGGCDGSDDTGTSIAKSRNTLEALGSGGTAAAPPSLRDRQFGEAAGAVGKASGSGSSEALAQALGGQALAGQAELAMRDYRVADGQLLRLMSVARAKLRLYNDQRALAAALSTYNPQPDIDKFDQSLAERRSELAKVREALAANDAKVQGILDQAKAKADEGRAMREAAASLEQSLLAASAQDRAAQAEQVRTARRAVDAVLRQADELEVQAARVAPTSAELRLQVAQVERQIESLEKAKAGARERFETERRQSAEASRAADTAATELDAAIDAVLTHFDEKSRPTFDAAQSKLSQASSKVGAARTSGGASAQVASGLVAHAQASMQREFAEALGRVAALVDEAAKLQPGTPGASRFATRAAETSEQHKAAVASAAEMYDRAKSSFGSGGGGDTGERVQRLAALLEQRASALAGRPEPAPEGEAPQDGSSEGQTPEGQAPEGDAPADAVPPAEDVAPAPAPER